MHFKGIGIAYSDVLSVPHTDISSILKMFIQIFSLLNTRLHLQGKVARRAIVFNNLAQIMQSCTNPAISQIRNRHMRHVLNAHEHQFDKTPPNRAR